MFRLLNILLYFFLGLTVLLIIVHIQKTEYYENPSKEITEVIYEGQTKISVYLSKYRNDDYTLNLSLYDIKSDINVNNISVQVRKINDEKSSSLNLIKILPYSGMHNWDIPEFKVFNEIPNNLRILNIDNNPYFAYDFVFKQEEEENKNDKFLVKINLNFSEQGNEKNLTKELVIQKQSKIELKPLDAHSDVSFLFIPITAFFTIILTIIRMVYKRKKNVA